MKREEFVKVAEEFHAKEETLLGEKRSEYATQDGDALENFKTLSVMLGISPSQVAATYLAKHIQAILKQVNDGQFTWAWSKDDGSEALKQRISDARNYLLLLAACIEEEQPSVPPADDRAAMERSLSSFIRYGRRDRYAVEEGEQ